ncbi:MAG TPA: GNAT family N-acetyltransferase [Dehalococcoidia bacterium]|nr:GNAT family N-acetyltransferase [Dehalococcoidia bacterium]
MEKGTVNIRRMARSDIDGVLALERKIGKGQSRITYRDMRTTTDPEGPLDLSFVSETEGQVIGFILARLAYVGIPFTEVCFIHGIVVDPDYQRSGIGNRLINSLVEHCYAEGINMLRALVPEHDDELRRFVQQLGFRPSNIINYDKSFNS